MKRELLLVVGLLSLAAVPLRAQDAAQATGSSKETAKQDEAKQEQAKKDEAKKEEPIRRTEQVVVESASKVETTVVNAPATLSVVTSEQLATSPARNYADLLRSVPGMNVIQMSARDVNLSTRQPTATLSNSQLVLVDGRSVYLDFFGLVLWDFVPPPGSNDIKQIEVVRGPASVVWGANALSGVVNIITKAPRENPGFGLTLGAGLFGRQGGSRDSEGNGYQYNGQFSYAAVANDTWSYKLSAGYLNVDPYSRPIGSVPLGCHPLGVSPCRDASGNAVPGGFPTGGAPYPKDQAGGGNFSNSGTSQPRAELRVDQDLKNGGRLTYEGGYAGTEGIIHTGIGPFDIQSGSYMAYGRALYSKGALRLSAFGNFVDASAPNLLQTDPATLKAVVLGFTTQTYDLEVGNSTVLAGKHVLTYGGNFRRNNFNITLAPAAQDRNEFGAYLQEEFFVQKFRLAAGARADKYSNIDHVVFSPRLSVMFKPTPDQSIRASYNRAFRSPSVINNYLDQNIFSPTAFDLRPLGAVVPALQPLIPNEPFLLTINTFGNPDLKEQHVDAFELAYTGTLAGRTTVSAAVYQNDLDNDLNFTYLLPNTEHPQGLPGLEFYSPSNPARGVGVQTGTPFTLSPVLMAALAQVPAPYGPILFPYKVATYLNLGPIRYRGFEASVQHRVSTEWSLFGNYSYQGTPKVLDPASGQLRYPTNEVTVPAKNRFNLGVSYNGRRFLGDLNLNYADKAFWNDVLNEPYWGYTKAYTMLNATFGVKLADGKVGISLRGTNLLDQDIQQHVYGDLIRRSLVAELRYFAK